jgi:hypothetical protein
MKSKLKIQIFILILMGMAVNFFLPNSLQATISKTTLKNELAPPPDPNFLYQTLFSLKRTNYKSYKTLMYQVRYTHTPQKPCQIHTQDPLYVFYELNDSPQKEHLKLSQSSQEYFNPLNIHFLSSRQFQFTFKAMQEFTDSLEIPSTQKDKITVTSLVNESEKTPCLFKSEIQYENKFTPIHQITIEFKTFLGLNVGVKWVSFLKNLFSEPKCLYGECQ